MPIEETKIVTQLNPEIQKISVKKTVPEEDFSKILEITTVSDEYS